MCNYLPRRLPWLSGCVLWSVLQRLTTFRGCSEAFVGRFHRVTSTLCSVEFAPSFSPKFCPSSRQGRPVAPYMCWSFPMMRLSQLLVVVLARSALPAAAEVHMAGYSDKITRGLCCMVAVSQTRGHLNNTLLYILRSWSAARPTIGSTDIQLFVLNARKSVVCHCQAASRVAFGAVVFLLSPDHQSSSVILSRHVVMIIIIIIIIIVIIIIYYQTSTIR